MAFFEWVSAAETAQLLLYGFAAHPAMRKETDILTADLADGNLEVRMTKFE